MRVLQQGFIASDSQLKRLWRQREYGCLRVAILALLFAVMVSSSDAVAQSDKLLGQLEQAAALIADNRTADAEKKLLSILRVAPREPAALNLLGTVRAKQGRPHEAEALFLRAIRGVMRKGGGFSDIWMNLLPLAIILAVVATLAVKRYRRTLD